MSRGVGGGKRLPRIGAAVLFAAVALAIGLGGREAEAMPVAGADPGGNAVLSTGNEYACAVDSNGVLNCWGVDSYSLVSAAPTGTFSAVSSAWTNACALRTDGAVVCWGLNNAIVSAVPPGDYTAISVGQDAACALRADGTAVCWGSASSGITLPAVEPLAGIAVSEGSACGITLAAGEVVCWGSEVPFFRSAAPVGRLLTVQAAAVFSRYCGIRADRSLVCWGNQVHFDVPMPTTGQYISVAQASVVGCATRSDGKLVCWGNSASREYSQAPTATEMTFVSGRLAGMAGISTDDVMLPWGAGSTRRSFNGPIIIPKYPAGRMGDAYPNTFLYDEYIHSPAYNNFRLISGTLPPGLSLDASTGNLVGTPTTAGTFTFTIGADSGASPIAPGAATVTIDQAAVAGLVIEPATSTITQGESQGYVIYLVTASGYRITNVSADPAATLSIADGACSAQQCTATEVGTHSVTATYPDGSGGVYTARATLTVVAAPAATVTMAPTTARVAVNRSAVFAMTLARGDFTTDVTAQTVFSAPHPVTCAANACASPRAGTFTVTATWTDADGTEYTRTAQLVVTDTSPPTPTSSPTPPVPSPVDDLPFTGAPSAVVGLIAVLLMSAGAGALAWRRQGRRRR